MAMLYCPKCTTDTLQRSERDGFIQTWILPLLKLSPWTCAFCRRVFYRKQRVER
jgi:hypothetical protein